MSSPIGVRTQVVLCLAAALVAFGCSDSAAPGADVPPDALTRDAVALDVAADGTADVERDPCGDVSCPTSPSPCMPNLCDPARGRCVASPRAAGTVCDGDDDPCTLEACDDRGVCQFLSWDLENPDCDDPCAAIEACDNGLDDDCDGATDCEDGACAAHPACSARCGEPVATLTCGELAARHQATSGSIGAYSCAGAPPMPGSEAVYTFTPEQDQLVRLTVDAEPQAYAWVLLLADECTGAQCAEAAWLGDADDTLIAAVTAGVPHHVVVDASVGGVLSVGGVWLECSAGEVCDNGDDDDWDDRVDCADPDCAADPLCEARETRCDDAFDNDADGWTDCADSDCHGVGVCQAEESVCDDGVDNDADGATDCDDTQCYPAPECLTSCEDAVRPVHCGWRADSLATTTQTFPESACVDGSWLSADVPLLFRADVSGPVQLELLHNRTELLVAVLEGGCDADVCLGAWRPLPQHVVTAAEFDAVAGQDYLIVLDANENLGAALSFESVAIVCTSPEVCDDGEDNDRDGDTDCADDDCRDAGPPCEPQETLCADGRDNDGDRLTDCADPDCAEQGPPCEATETLCEDGEDNDGDGLTDCDDPSCADHGACVAQCGGEPIPIECGYLNPEVPSGRASALPASPCLEVATPGDELVFTITPTEDVEATFEILGAEANGHVVVTLHEGACAADTCIAWPDPAGTPGLVTAPLTAGVDYFFVVDSTQPGGPGGDRVRFLCEPAPPR